MSKTDKDQVVIGRIQSEIEKINNKTNNIYFFVLDTKGNPSGSLEYIYKLAYILKEGGYNVTMLYQEDDEFVGVGEWLGEKYAQLPHENIVNEGTSVSPSDILFIPEIFSNVMTQAKQLPCKKVAILQNYDFITEQIPLSVQWGDFNVMDAIVNTEDNIELLKGIFPYVKATLVTPYIDEMFHDTIEPKQMVVNIVSKNPSDITKVVKPFYWAYPTYKWVSFRDLRGFSKEEFANKLREGAMTIWIDNDASFGYSALEAMKSGSFVISKLPNNKLPWVVDENGDLNDCCLWFDNVHQLPKIIANVVRKWVTDTLPKDTIEVGKDVASKFNKETTERQILDFINDVLDRRKTELNNLILSIEKKED